MTEVHGKTALVTGASYGIGREIARELAKRGCNLVLVSRSTELLGRYAEELGDCYGVKADVITADLSKPGAAEELYAKCAKRGMKVSILVNDAGFSVKTDDEWKDVRRVESMLELLAVTPASLCSRFGADMIREGEGFILNVSSSSAYFPVGMMRTYSAIKTYLLRYTRLLHYEMRPSNVRVTCLAPGGVRSHFFDANSIEVPGRFEWVTKLFLMSSARVGRIAVRGMLRGRITVIPGLLTKFFVLFTFIIPKKWTYRAFTAIEKLRKRLMKKERPAGEER